MKSFNCQNERVLHENVEVEVRKRVDLLLKEQMWQHRSIIQQATNVACVYAHELIHYHLTCTHI